MDMLYFTENICENDEISWHPSIITLEFSPYHTFRAMTSYNTCFVFIFCSIHIIIDIGLFSGVEYSNVSPESLSDEIFSYDVSSNSISPYCIISTSKSQITTIFIELYWSYVFINGSYISCAILSTFKMCILS